MHEERGFGETIPSIWGERSIKTLIASVVFKNVSFQNASGWLNFRRGWRPTWQTKFARRGGVNSVCHGVFFLFLSPPREKTSQGDVAPGCRRHPDRRILKSRPCPPLAHPRTVDLRCDPRVMIFYIMRK